MTELSLFADAPLSLIAKKAGVGQGTMYRHFPNRETLVLEAPSARCGIPQTARPSS